MQPVATDVVWSVCLSVGHKCEPCKLIRVSFGGMDSGVPKEPHIGGSPNPPRKRQFLGTFHAL